MNLQNQVGGKDTPGERMGKDVDRRVSIVKDSIKVNKSLHMWEHLEEEHDKDQHPHHDIPHHRNHDEMDDDDAEPPQIQIQKENEESHGLSHSQPVRTLQEQELQNEVPDPIGGGD